MKGSHPGGSLLALGGLRALFKEFNQADFFLGTRRYPDT
jgi:hypothetical protein